MRSLGVLAGALLAVAAAQVAARQQPATTAMVPASTLDAAAADPLSAVFLLSQLAVPVGIVTTANPSAPRFRDLMLELKAERTTPLARVVERLGSGGGDATRDVQWRDGVLGIVGPGLVCAAEVQTVIGPASVEGHMPQLLGLLGWLAGDQSGPVPASTISPATGEADARLMTLESLRVEVGEGATLEMALDDVVRRSRGGAWIVWQHAREDGRTGCRLAGYFPNGYVGAASVDFAAVASNF